MHKSALIVLLWGFYAFCFRQELADSAFTDNMSINTIKMRLKVPSTLTRLLAISSTDSLVDTTGWQYQTISKASFAPGDLYFYSEMPYNEIVSTGSSTALRLSVGSKADSDSGSYLSISGVNSPYFNGLDFVGAKHGSFARFQTALGSKFVTGDDSLNIQGNIVRGNNELLRLWTVGNLGIDIVPDSTKIKDALYINSNYDSHRRICVETIQELTGAISRYYSGEVYPVTDIEVSGNIPISTNYEIPKDINLTFASGGLLTVLQTCTLTINGKVFAEHGRHVFDGEIRFDSTVATVYPEMWGIEYDTSMCRQQIQSAIRSLSRGGKVVLGNNTYRIDSAIVCFNEQPIEFCGSGNSSVIYQTDSIAGRHGFWIGKGNKYFHNFKIQGSPGYKQNSGFYIADWESATTNISDITIEKIWIEDFNSGIVSPIMSNSHISECTIYNNPQIELDGAGIQIGSSQDVWIKNNFIYSKSAYSQHGMYINNDIRRTYIINNSMKGWFRSCGIQARIDHSDYGIYADGLWIEGNSIDSCGNTGILIYSTSGTDHNTENRNVFVNNNSIKNIRSLSGNSGRGISYSLYGIDGYSINNNIIDSIDGVGIELAIKIDGWNRNGTIDGNKIKYWNQGDHGAAWAGIYCLSDQYMQNLSFSRNMLVVDGALTVEPLPIYVYRSSDDSKRENIIVDGNQVLNSTKDVSNHTAWNRTVRHVNNSWNLANHLGDESPITGCWKLGDFVRDTTPGTLIDSEYVNIGWIRMTNGCDNVIGYDWRYVRVFAKDPTNPVFYNVQTNTMKTTSDDIIWPATQYKIALNNKFGMHGVDNSYSIFMHNTYYNSGFKYATDPGGSFDDACYMRMGANGFLWAVAGKSTGQSDPVTFIYPMQIDTSGLTTLRGQIILEDSALAYDDLRILPSSFSFPGSNDPSLVKYSASSVFEDYGYEFQVGDTGWFSTQVPHMYNPGTSMGLHLHWTPHTNGTTENGNTVAWNVQIVWANIEAAFTSVTNADLTDACDGVNYKHKMTPEQEISGTGKTESSMILGKVWRASDSWSGTSSGNLPILLEVDFHYQKNKIGSPLN